MVSGEFRRSTSVDAAGEMLMEGDWVELQVQPERSKNPGLIRPNPYKTGL